jgi:hypothetical protein
MTRYHGGEIAKAGFYWNPAGWEITTTKKGEALPGTKETRYLRIPTILLMLVPASRSGLLVSQGRPACRPSWKYRVRREE